MRGALQALKDEGNLKFEVSETDGHVFRVDERWTSKRTMFKCVKLVPLKGVLLGSLRYLLG